MRTFQIKIGNKTCNAVFANSKRIIKIFIGENCIFDSHAAMKEYDHNGK